MSNQRIYDDLLCRIDEKKRLLDTHRPLTSGELARLRDEFVIEFTYDSNAIEGSTLTLRETALVLEGVTIDKRPLKDHLEAVGHRDAFNYIQQLIEDTPPLSERIIREIHSLVLLDMPEDRGVYRRIPVRIAGAVHQPPQPYMISKMMEQLLMDNTENQFSHVIERIAWFHLTFEGIHPFIDGNGRTGRLLLNFGLMCNGYPPIDVKFTDRIRYYDAFSTYYRDKDMSAMVILMGEYVDERLALYLKLFDSDGESGLC
ncbi:MAG: Fic family protein [Clostridiales bacterium]|jgi:Fic family protein|nr:Fic family protein [Clostridiales bacterium]